MRTDCFRDKVVVITGATGGVGRATARVFALHGAKLVLLARSLPQLEATHKEVVLLGGRALTIPTDVADSRQVEAAAEQAEKEFGPIDVWINNAMASVFAPLDNISPEEYKRVTEVTYLGQVYGTMSALKRMRRRDKGSIVLVGSALAYRGIPLQSAYCGAKHGIKGFYESLRVELKHNKSHIKTCMVQLPAMNTTQFGWVLNKLPNKPKPMGKIYEPEVAARALFFAAAHNRRSIWVGWSTFKTILGNSVVPTYADWVLSRKGYEGQQTEAPVEVNRPNNVWEPVQEDRGAHGDFSRQSSEKSFTLWMALHRRIVAMVVGLGAVGAWWKIRRR